MSSRLVYAALVAAFSAGLVGSAHAASLIGNVIEAEWNYPNKGTHDPEVTINPLQFVVTDSGFETIFDLTDQGLHSVFITANFSAFQLVLTITETVPDTGRHFIIAPFNGPHFKLISGNPFPQVVNATTSDNTAISAFIENGDLFVQLTDWFIAPGDFATINFAATDVPIPAALPLFAAGVGAIALVVRRRRRKVNAA